MRISDWSSDVCSSDLPPAPRPPGPSWRDLHFPLQPFAPMKRQPSLSCQATHRRPHRLPVFLPSRRYPAFASGGFPVPAFLAVKKPTPLRLSPAAQNQVSRPSRLRERSEEHTSELQSLMRISYAVFCLKKKKRKDTVSYNNKITRDHK